MYCLNLDTSTNTFSLALSKDGKVLRFRNAEGKKLLENSIIPTIDRLLESAGVSLEQVDVFAIGLGPGSFTSLRVGLATIKAFAIAGAKKVIGIGSLDIIAQAHKGTACDAICVLVDARRGQVYSCTFDRNGQRQGEYILATPDKVLTALKGKVLFVGDGLALYGELIKTQKHITPIFADQDAWYPQAKYLAELAQQRITTNTFDNPISVVPIYLYAQDCQVTPKK